MSLQAKLLAASIVSLVLIAALSLFLFRGAPGPGIAGGGPQLDGGGAEPLPVAAEPPAAKLADEAAAAGSQPTAAALDAPASPPAAGPGWTLTGRVVRRDAASAIEPVPDVAVIVRGHPRQTKPEDAPPPIRVATDAAGRFEVQGVKPDVKLRLEVDEPSSALRALSFRLGTPGDDARRDLGDIPLEPGTTLAINVFGPDGAPVEKAEVLVGRDVDGDFPPGQHALDQLGFKDSRRDIDEKGGGAYVLERTGPGPHSVRVTAKGCAPWTANVDLPRAEPLEVRLIAGHTIAGTVRAAGGKPIAGAIVEVDSGPDIINPDPQAKTDAAGRFSFDNLSAGDFELSAVADGYALDQRRGVAAGTEDLVFLLEREAVLAGKVVAEEGEAPVARATVRLRGATGSSYSARTEDDGSFRVRKIAPGTYTIEADHEEHGTATAEPRELAAGEAVEGVVLKLPAGFAARFQVTDSASRAPVPEATVTLVLTASLDQGPTGRQRRGKSDADGTAIVKGLSPGTWQHSAQAKGYLRSKPTPVVLEKEGGAPVAIALDPGGSIAGRVLDRSGKPIAGATVRPGVQNLSPEDWNAGLGNVLQMSAQSDAGGNYLLEGLLPHDRYIVMATHGEFASGTRKGLEVGQREAVEGADIQLLRGGTIRGRVTDERGEPVAGAVLSLGREKDVKAGAAADEEDEEGEARAMAWAPASNKERTPTASTAEDGSYTLAHVGAGTYTIVARGKDRLPAQRSGIVVADEETASGVDLELRNGEVLVGRVEDVEGQPLPGASVDVQGTSQAQGKTNAEGRFEIAGVAPGQCNVSVSLAGYQSAQAQATVPQKELTVRLERSAAIAGEIRAARPVDFRNAQVMALVQREGGSQSGPVWSQRGAQDGKFEVEVRAGTYVIRVNVPGFPAAYSRPVTVAAGQRADDVVIELKEGGRITGLVVLRATGEPLREAAVTVQGIRSESWDVSWFTPSAQTDASGAFTIEGVPDGVVSVHAQHRDHTPAQVEGVAVRAGSTAEVRLELGSGGGIRGVVTRGGSPARGRTVIAVKSQDPGAQNPGEQKNATVAADGTFELKGLSPGTYTLHLIRNQWGGFGGGRQSTRTVEVIEGQVAEVTWDEAAGIRVHGTVSAGGAPVAGRTLQLLQPGGAGDAGRARTGPAGEYAVEVPGPGTYMAFLDGQGGGTKVEIVVPAGVTEHRHDIELAGGQLAGVVVDAASGAPVRGAQVIALAAGAASRSLRQLIEGVKSVGRTDDGGRFVLAALEPGTFTLRVMSPGYADTLVDGVVLPQDGAARESRIELEAGVELGARVLDPQGRPLAQARAVIRDAAGNLVQLDNRGASDATGALTISGLRPAPHEITIVHSAYAPARIVVDVAAGVEPAIQLTPGGRVAVRVADRRGRPVPGASVDLLDERGESVLEALLFAAMRDGPRLQGFQTGADGSVTFDHVPAGRLRAVATLGEARSREERVTVEDGGAVEAALRLDP
jgi:protocatechuate 3,4-dioxygenase beta subunit